MPSIRFTSLNIMTSFNASNVITIWLMSAIKVTALFKNLCPEMNGVQEKESIMGVRVDRKIHPSRSQSGITRQAE